MPGGKWKGGPGSLAFFAKADLQASLPAGPGFEVMWKRKILPLLIKGQGDGFRVSEYFRKLLDPDAFARYLSESTRVTVFYRKRIERHVTFRLLLPLANELVLKDTLDSLFYSDRILRRLAILDRGRLEAQFPKRRAEKGRGNPAPGIGHREPVVSMGEKLIASRANHLSAIQTPAWVKP